MADPTQALASASYVSLATFRRDGREVATPVWVVALDGRFYVYSENHAGKVKRIRATGKVRLAPCTFRGKVTGEWVEGGGRIVTEPELERRFYRALAKKYGIQYWVGTALSFLSRKIGNRIVIELALAGGAA